MRLLTSAAMSVLLLGAPARAHAQSPANKIFEFHTDELWLNLHHFLYVLGRAQAKTSDASREAVVQAPVDAEREMPKLSPSERTAWAEAVSFYAGSLSQKDAVFDTSLATLTRTLASAGDASRIEALAIDPGVRTTLERAAPIYRKAWWPRQHAANIAARDSIRSMVDRYGTQVLAYITRAYGLPWPSGGYPVHFSGYANWAGAYSTAGNLLVVSSLDRSALGSMGLETVFHEGMHQWDDTVFLMLRAHARKIAKLVPANISHALIFYTAGEAVRHAIPSHVTIGEAGVWERGLSRFLDPLRKAWQPWLDGRGTRDEAMAALIAATATEARRPAR